MPQFSLPIHHGNIPPSSRIRLTSSKPSRKRKRSSSSSPASEDIPLHVQDHTSLPAASTNPLSLTPSEVAQYQLAGLDLDEELPSKVVRDFPHRRVPERLPPPPHGRKSHEGKEKVNLQEAIDTAIEDENGDGDGDRAEFEGRPRREWGPRLRIHHFGVLTAVLHRCLLEGDIQRASRAWAMLLRGEFGGRGIDIRSSGYWGIGAELLIRSEGRDFKGKGRAGERVKVNKSDSVNDDDGSGKDIDNGARRWGSAAGLEKAKDYYDRLILQHPYMRQYHESVTAFDFWPAKLGCEIYGIQFEQKEGLRRIAIAEKKDEENVVGTQSEESEGELDHVEEDFSSQERREMRRRKRRADKRWEEREEIRQTALVAAEKVAGRMDELMASPPYSDSHILLRLRGMLALYIGDLSVPALPMDEEAREDSDDEQLQQNRRWDIRGVDAERRLLLRQRKTDHERGKRKQAEERARARKLFEKITREGGNVDNVRDLSPSAEDEEDIYGPDRSF